MPDETNSDHGSDSDESLARVTPISANARRLLGVLVEKAKTTPDNYPLSLAGMITGANQKSNRDPQMQLDEDDALLAMDELKAVGAAREIQGGSRVTKFRHAAYEWLNVDSPGAAIMTELMLRGPQTVGEIRTRASRMHAFIDLAAVQKELDALAEKDLVEPLTPVGRGQVFAHKLYPATERQFLVAKVEKRLGSETVKPQAQTTEHASKIETIQAKLDDVTERLAKLEAQFNELVN
ncbi:MAG: YceH family protein [Planctomycetota bacterium]